MTTQNWLDLNEFSSKYKISLSTLRRRIRDGEIENLFRDGKYWLPDQPIAKNIRTKESIRKLETRKEPKPIVVEEAKPAVIEATVGAGAAPSIKVESQMHAELKNLVHELKSAYVTVLHDKEDQITQLKEEIADLKTLVKILESENERLKMQPHPAQESQPPIIENWQLGDLDI